MKPVWTGRARVDAGKRDASRFPTKLSAISSSLHFTPRRSAHTRRRRSFFFQFFPALVVQTFRPYPKLSPLFLRGDVYGMHGPPDGDVCVYADSEAVLRIFDSPRRITTADSTRSLASPFPSPLLYPFTLLRASSSGGRLPRFLPVSALSLSPVPIPSNFSDYGSVLYRRLGCASVIYNPEHLPAPAGEDGDGVQFTPAQFAVSCLSLVGSSLVAGVLSRADL
jgi:hypothetical protein